MTWITFGMGLVVLAALAFCAALAAEVWLQWLHRRAMRQIDEEMQRDREQRHEGAREMVREYEKRQREIDPRTEELIRTALGQKFSASGDKPTTKPGADDPASPKDT